ncbi:MAG TPA: substrate-binding domain-containing protein, partial [Polyangiaceae bacterium]|nr:substrate-binding domain-containing protein [Polyangiaceae bacterium]
MSSPSQDPPLIALARTESSTRQPSGRGTRRATIGVLLDYINFFSRGYQTQLRNALHAEAHRLGIDLLFYFGRALEEPNPHSAAHNKIFQLMHPDTLDGMIVMSTCLCPFCGTDGILKFFQGWPRIPQCSIGIAIPGVPSILVDNRRGMTDVVEHLIEVHHCRRLAFIMGAPANPESDLRFDAYRNVLVRHGLAIDPALLAVGNFFKQEGHAAMEEILERHVPIDAVVAANDNMALGAIELLLKRGLQVPGDLPVTGFDDLELAKAGNPPLTTVRQPFRLMAETAIRIILDQIEGRPVAERIELPTEFVVRHSCGCDRKVASRDIANIVLSPVGAIQFLERDAARISRTLMECMEVEGVEGARDVTEMLATLQAELAGNVGAFQRQVRALLQRPTHAEYQNYRMLHDVISYLRSELRPFSTNQLEDLWFEASRQINGASTTAQALHRVRADENYLQLLVAGEQSSAALDLPSLKAVLEKNLPEMGVTTAFLSRYVGGTSNELEPFVYVLDGAVRTTTSERFPDYQLVPEGFWSRSDACSWLVFPLAFEGQLLGVAVFQFLSSNFGYDVIRDQISASLRSVELHHEVVEKTTLHERSVQERLATTNRMQSLSVLAGGVAHDLNNVLGPLVALPDIMLRDLAGWNLPEPAVADVRNDIESIKAASLRATQTIKDLLTLARQGQIERELLDLNRLTANCLTDGSVRFVQDERHRVRVLLELTPEITTIRGSEPHLVRAITNLVRNAMEAISGNGDVKVSTSVTRVVEPLVGYETIEPGNYVVLSVADNGRGIP